MQVAARPDAPGPVAAPSRARRVHRAHRRARRAARRGPRAHQRRGPRRYGYGPRRASERPDNTEWVITGLRSRRLSSHPAPRRTAAGGTHSRAGRGPCSRAPARRRRSSTTRRRVPTRCCGVARRRPRRVAGRPATAFPRRSPRTDRSSTTGRSSRGRRAGRCYFVPETGPRRRCPGVAERPSASWLPRRSDPPRCGPGVDLRTPDAEGRAPRVAAPASTPDSDAGVRTNAKDVLSTEPPAGPKTSQGP